MPTAEAKYHIKENADSTRTHQDNPLYGIAHYNLEPLRTAVIHTFRKRPECNNTAVFLSVTPNEKQQQKKTSATFFINNLFNLR